MNIDHTSPVTGDDNCHILLRRIDRGIWMRRASLRIAGAIRARLSPRRRSGPPGSHILCFTSMRSRAHGPGLGRAVVSTIGHLLIIAAAVAISSVPIVMTILILLSPNRTRSAVPFLIGWVIGIVVTVSIAALFATVLPSSRFERQPDTAVAIVEIVLGVAAMVLGVLSWFRRRKSGVVATTPKWMRAEANMGAWSAFGLGFILNLRPKGIVLALAAGLTLYADAGSVRLAIIPVIIYTVVAASTVAFPIIVTAASPTRMQPKLIAAHQWMETNGGLLTSAILVVIGLLIVGMGISRL
ncbi:GAP family protein [Microbacterium sp. QXD-8]|uniref:GAP family protein n=1 Tax=Microbacterium psychrotolerans TaxID=3068321 RepID=A0ABU0Z6N3_9MICO|nr:GAP family protein [Microbacterium sp. QXD-8]MDQ7880187.1 GAP family protein [Microbacterium sp. QXD-8]